MRQENYHRRKGFGEMEATLRQGSTQKSCLLFFSPPPPLLKGCKSTLTTLEDNSRRGV